MTEELRTPVFEVLDGGLQATIQDLGRLGHVHEGVPRSGAADGLSLAVANLLAGNPPSTATLEVTVAGLRLRAHRAVTVGLAGADLGATLAFVSGGGAPRRLAPSRSYSLGAGDELAFEGRAADGLGCRAYLAIPGGFDVPEVLGSRSTSLVGAFGGFEGRALRVGDVLSAARAPLERPTMAVPADRPLPSPAQRIRILPVPGEGPAASSAAERLAAQAWTVSGDSDRRGLRLAPASGESLPSLGDAGVGTAVETVAAAADRPSEPVVPGTIQVTPSGQPLVLMPDAGTTGGYAVAAVVIAADLPILGQLAPWDEVRFRVVDLAIATEAASERRRLLDGLAAALGVDVRVS